MEFTKERFLKIQSWSETYGPGSNVVLPAEEAAELARMALASMDSELVMYQARMWNPEYEEWDPWAECNENAFVVFSQEAERGEGMEVRKLYSAPQPLPVVDSDPVAYTDERNLGYIDRGRETAYLWGKQNSETSDVALYRHAQPAPVVPLPDVVSVLLNHLEDVLPDDAFNLIDVKAWNAVSMLTCPDACRAAMLQAGDTVRDLSTPVDPQVAEYEQNVMQDGNSPVIPDGYVMVPKEPTESMINAWLSEVANWRGHIAGYKAMLAAAPQEEVKGE